MKYFILLIFLLNTYLLRAQGQLSLQIVKTKQHNYCAFSIDMETFDPEKSPIEQVSIVTADSLSKKQILHSLRYSGFDEATRLQIGSALGGALGNMAAQGIRSTGGIVWKSVKNTIPIGATLGMVVAGIKNEQSVPAILIMSLGNAVPVPFLSFATESIIRRLRMAALSNRKFPLPQKSKHRFIEELSAQKSESGESCILENLDIN